MWPPLLLSHWSSSWTVPLTLVLRFLASTELQLYWTNLPRLIISRTIWSEWTRSRWSPLAWCRMSLKRIVGTRNILAALMTLSLWLWNSTGYALCDWQEATKMLEGSLDSERPQASLLERMETYCTAWHLMPLDKQLGKQGRNFQFCDYKIFQPSQK